MSSLTQGPVSIPRTGKLLSCGRECGLRRASSASVLGRRPGPADPGWGRTLPSSLPPRLSPSFSFPLPLPSPSASQRWQPLQMETPGWTGSSLQWPLTCLQLICWPEPGLLGPYCITPIPRFCGAISDLPLQGA